MPTIAVDKAALFKELGREYDTCDGMQSGNVD